MSTQFNLGYSRRVSIFLQAGVSLTTIITFEDPRDAEDAHYNMDHARFMGRDIEVEFTRGYRKTPAEMRTKERRDDGGRGGVAGRRHRSRSRSRTRSRSASKKGRDQYTRRSNDRRDDGRRKNSNARAGTHSRSPTRSRSPSHEDVENGVESRKDSRRNDRRDGRASRSPPPKRRGSGSRSRSGSY
ncbi:FUS-interacting serine-arginine-rich protein 1 [Fasciola hepatica]|uniref:FUS-interacting serine-arginine-rich protein 1 n=1 Tax=Fasciola hepatica TaxID=6192 RepID=A0A4E0RBX9_FASHE|nr:FUS-interacting serine-arginine-rich protein 1 [Fasciola hepatica]